MKFNLSTLLAIAIAAPVAVQAFPFSIAIKSEVNGGLMKVFPDGDYVKLKYDNGQDAQDIGDLIFDEPSMQRFDIVDDRHQGQEHENEYLLCYASVAKDPELKEDEQVVITVEGKLDDPKAVVGEGYEDKVKVNCIWNLNDSELKYQPI